MSIHNCILICPKCEIEGHTEPIHMSKEKGKDFFCSLHGPMLVRDMTKEKIDQWRKGQKEVKDL